MNTTLDMDALRRDGIVEVPLGLGAGQAWDIRRHLRGCWCYPGHVKVYGDRVARSFNDTRRVFDVWCHDMEDVVRAPHVWDLVASMMPAVGRYLEAPPRLYSMNAFWTRPSYRAAQPDIQEFHRDADDLRFLVMFVYGTDVLLDDDGPHRFIPGSHLEAEDFIRPCTSIYGRAGTVFLADTRGLHMGEKPCRGDRLVLWARWGVSDRPQTYDTDQLHSVSRSVLGDKYPRDPVIQDQIKLVVA